MQLLQPYKDLRRRAVRTAYLYKAAPVPGEVNHARLAISGRVAAITVAYNTPWVTDWQFRFSHNLGPVARLIADNSSNPEKSREIKAIAAEYDTTYLRLPFNRFSEGRPKSASLSHACALNWLWRRVVVPAMPKVVAILDHDLIPVRPVDLATKVADQPFYGVRIEGAYAGWHLWPGYAVFREDVIRDLLFWPNPRAGLDTGGANWDRLFCQYDPQTLKFAPVPARDLGTTDEWFHVGEASEYYGPRGAEWRQTVEATLKSHL